MEKRINLVQKKPNEMKKLNEAGAKARQEALAFTTNELSTRGIEPSSPEGQRQVNFVSAFGFNGILD